MFLEAFGLMWIILIIMIGIFGGEIVIKIKNSCTHNLHTLTDVTINHKMLGGSMNDEVCRERIKDTR